MKFGVRGRLVVKARSSVHDTTTTWDKLTGEAEADPDAIDAATAQVTVDMTSFDAGDWLKNRKLRKDFALEDHPTATFQLEKVSSVQRDGAKFTATAEGTLRWRGKQVPLTLTGHGSLDDKTLSATASFELDIKLLGLTPPKLFMFKVEDVVTVEVTLSGTR